MKRKQTGDKKRAGENRAMVPASVALSAPQVRQAGGYGRLVSDISGLLEQARHSAARSVNNILTAAYWDIGRRIVEFEQGGKSRATYGERLLAHLSKDLTAKHGRGFSERNLEHMRNFYLGWVISQTPSAKLEARAKCPTLSSEFNIGKPQTRSAISAVSSMSVAASDRLNHALAGAFPLSWSHYVRLMAVGKPHARAFYEAEAIRGGWSVRQMDRQISTQFYERTAHSKHPKALLDNGRKPLPEDAVSVEDQVRDPYLLEFLNLKDEYGESELEEALVRHLETFLLELGNGFAFVARQKRIRIGDEWYRIDLLLFHRRLKCLVVIDLKIGKFTHGDAGQMNMYLNYAREHMMEPGENEPVGLILCSARNEAVVHYAMGGIKAKVFASHYLTALPDSETLRQEIMTTQRALRGRQGGK
jgi:predicted nuclease of restriction endonuclease-like (RecB) superfamily